MRTSEVVLPTLYTTLDTDPTRYIRLLFLLHEKRRVFFS